MRNPLIKKDSHVFDTRRGKPAQTRQLDLQPVRQRIYRPASPFRRAGLLGHIAADVEIELQCLDIGDIRRPCPRLKNRQLDVLDRRGKIPWHDITSASRQLHTRIPNLSHTVRLSAILYQIVKPADSNNGLLRLRHLSCVDCGTECKCPLRLIRIFPGSYRRKSFLPSTSHGRWLAFRSAQTYPFHYRGR